MSVALAPYTLPLTAASPLFDYTPLRDATVQTGWVSGYTVVQNGQPSGIAIRQTRLPGAGLSFEFQGTQFYFCFTDNGGHITLNIDNNPAPTAGFKAVVGTACASTSAEAAFVSDPLPIGIHKVSFTIRDVGSPDEPPFTFFGGGVTLGLNTNGKAVDSSTVIDDLDPGWGLTPGRVPVTGGWDTRSGDGLVGNSATFRCPYGPGPGATYSITGALGFVLNGDLWPETHAFSIGFDGTTYNFDGTTSFNDNSTVYFARGGLDPTITYSLSLMGYNSDQPNCTTQDEGGKTVDRRFCCIGFDSIVLLKASTTDLPSPSQSGDNSSQSSPVPTDPGPQSSGKKVPIGPIVGGVLGGVALGVIVGLLFFMFRRRQQRKEPPSPEAYTVASGTFMSEHAATPWTAEPRSPPPRGDYPKSPGTSFVLPYTYDPVITAASSSVTPAPEMPPIIHSPQRSVVNLHPNLNPNKSGSSMNPNKAAAAGAAPSVAPSSPRSPGSPPLGQADLERVLAFVAQRMDPTAPGPSQQQPLHDEPPSYSHA